MSIIARAQTCANPNTTNFKIVDQEDNLTAEGSLSDSVRPAVTPSENDVYLGSMRNLRPFSNGAACRASENQNIDQETGEIITQIDAVGVRLERWLLQSAIRHLLPKKRVAKCCRLRSSCVSDVSVLHNPEKKSAHFGGLQTCGSVWDCPVCAAKISERRRVNEVLPVMEQWKAQGNQCLLLTLTNPHNINDSLSSLLKGQQLAMSRLTSSRPYRAILKSISCIGTIRAWEVTHGENGFHPHFHIILFVESCLDIYYLQGIFYQLWANACRLARLSIPSPDRGCTLHDGSKAHAYASKGVWGLDHEITKGHLKKSNKGRSPMDLIRSYAYDDDKQAAAIFIEYSHAFHGKRQLFWSHGLKDYFSLGDITDEQIAAQQEENASILGRIDWPTWQKVLRSEKRGEILELARSGSWEPVAVLLGGLQ